jgi:hypothetical protein
MEKRLKEKLVPLYEKMLKDIPTNIRLSPFCLQWGKDYSINKGILFIGKATNGWVTDDRNVNNIFDEKNINRIFHRSDQMKWVENLDGNTQGYNTRKSSFWRVIKGITQSIFGDENWSSKIAWSNLYKLAPYDEGNPTEVIKNIQLESCCEIIKTEIEILQPRIVVFFTSGWEKNFLYYLNNNQHTHSAEKIHWNNGEFEINVYNVRNMIFIVSQHPQGKPEKEHIKTIVNIIKRLS